MKSLHALSFLVVILTVVDRACAQEAKEDPDGMVQLDLPNDVEVKVLVEYVGRRLGINILYDEAIANKRITLRAATPIPASSLQELLEAALKAKGLVLIDAETPGWKRIVEATALAEYAETIVDGKGKLPTGAKPATLAFKLQNVPVARADQIIKPFLSKPGGSSLVDADASVLLITDFALNLKRIERLLQWIDQPAPETTVRFVPVKHTGATDLAPQLTQLLQARGRASGKGTASRIDIASDERTNQLVLIGVPEAVNEALGLIDQLDVPLDIITKTYAFRHTAAERVDRLVQQLLSQQKATQRYTSALDEEANLLIVNATADVHRRIEELKRELDVAGAKSQSPIRFYELKNASADEVLATIRAIEGSAQRESGARDPNRILQRLAEERSPPPGPNFLPSAPGQPPPSPPVQAETSPPVGAPPGPGNINTPPMTDGSSNGAPPPGAGGLLGRAQVSSDPNTNTIIVVADPAVQALYAELIRRLDRRRPQVLIEVTVVTIDCTDDFALGIELSGSGNNGLKRFFALTSYGLSQVNPITGTLQIIPGTGFNGTLVDPELASAVVRAVASHSRGRVVAAPKLLVNDNATGVLTSVNEFPFNSVNASTTVATTSFGGFADAGTTISVSPRIGEGDFLELAITAELSSFTGGASQGLPPPRQNNALESDVTVPDGHTVILGGLRFNTKTSNVRTVPLLEKIPVIKYLVSSYALASSSTAIFFFIRPVILRDDEFQVLKYLSEKDLCRAKLPGNHPASSPVLVHDDDKESEWLGTMSEKMAGLEEQTEAYESIESLKETPANDVLEPIRKDLPNGPFPEQPASEPVAIPSDANASKISKEPPTEKSARKVVKNHWLRGSLRR